MAEQDIISALREISSNVRDIEDIIRDSVGKESFGSAASTRRVAAERELGSVESMLDTVSESASETSDYILDSLKSFNTGVSQIIDGIRDSIPEARQEELSGLVSKISEEVKGIGSTIFDSILDPKKFLEKTKEKFDQNPEVGRAIAEILQGAIVVPAGKKILDTIDPQILKTYQDIQKTFGGNLADVDARVRVTADGLGTFLTDVSRSTGLALGDNAEGIARSLGVTAGSARSNILKIGDDTRTTASNIGLAYKNFMEDATGATSDSIKINGISIAAALADYQGSFNDNVLPILKSSREGLSLAAEASSDGGRRIIQEVMLAGEAMNLSSNQVQAFISRNRDLTGRANTDLLRSSASVSAAVGERLGLSAKQIMPIMTEIISSVDRFGNVGVDAAGRISAQLLKTGTDFRQLDTIAGTFQGFEGASSAVAKLTAAFGVNLDAMELMRMANEDQAAILPYLQEQFSAAGVDISNTSLAMKRLLSDAFGGVGVANVERILSGTSEVFGDFNDKLKEDTSSALIDPVKGFESAIRDLTAVLVDPTQAAKRQFESLAAASVGQTIAATVGESSTAAMKGVTEITNKIKPEVMKYGQLLSELISIPINSASGGFDEIEKKLKALNEKYLSQTTGQTKTEPPKTQPVATPATPESVSPQVTQQQPAQQTQATTQAIEQPRTPVAAAPPTTQQILKAVINIDLGDEIRNITRNVALIDVTGGEVA